MIVVESGGTKSTWIFKDEKGSLCEVQTVGLHPQELSEDKRRAIKVIVSENKLENRELYFFGAGCESTEAKDKIKSFLGDFRLEIKQIETDIYAACKALLNDKKGIVGILGTGAVAASFDGEKVVKITSGWGYLLGDEGSGFDIGKRLLQEYLKGNLSPEIREEITKTFNNIPVLHRVYEPDGRKFIAGFTKIMEKYKSENDIQKILAQAFLDFCKTALFPIVKEGEVHFVGSIAYYFDKELEKALAQQGYSIGKISKEAGSLVYQYLTEIKEVAKKR